MRVAGNTIFEVTSMKGKMNFIAGILLGMFLITGTGAAATAIETVTASRSTNTIYVDGKQVTLDAYNINGRNYVMLRDVGKAVGFNVFWDGAVQIDSSAPYSGLPPEAPSADLDTARADLIQLINQTRSDYGVPALATNQALMDAAQDCSDKQFTWHHNKEECEAVVAHGYPYGFGSNLTVFTGVATSDIAKKAVENWVNSPGHLETMLDPNVDCIGVGVTDDGVRTFCYMFVGNPNTNNPYG